MQHFAQEKWAEFIRQTLPDDECREMQGHLDRGCRKCAELARLYVRIMRVGANENAYVPPEGVVRSVKAHFATQAAVKAARPAARSAFELLFDSLAHPVAAGARASVASARQLLYRVGSIYVDMRVDTEANSDRACLVGQMLDSSKPGHPVAGVPVVLLEGQKSIGRTSSNDNGEFQFEFRVRENLRLAVTVGRNAPVFLPITATRGPKKSAPRRGKSSSKVVGPE